MKLPLPAFIFRTMCICCCAKPYPIILTPLVRLLFPVQTGQCKMRMEISLPREQIYLSEAQPWSCWRCVRGLAPLSSAPHLLNRPETLSLFQVNKVASARDAFAVNVLCL